MNLHMNDRILFYREYDEYGEFSNFSKHGVTIDNIYYSTTEHYFQSMKFKNGNPEYAEKIRNASNPTLTKKLGCNRNVHGFDPNWEQNKIGVMMTALRAKFTQHKDLKKLLLSTKDKMLVEHTNIDKIWADGGDCGTGKIGKNYLGKCLMEVRKELGEKEK